MLLCHDDRISDGVPRFIAAQEYALQHGRAVRNTGSTARDHLANERTFLAYSRTGLAFMGAGVGLYSAFQPVMILQRTFLD